jgi:hypothetical protein
VSALPQSDARLASGSPVQAAGYAMRPQPKTLKYQALDNSHSSIVRASSRLLPPVQ